MNIYCEFCDRDFLKFEEPFKMVFWCLHVFCSEHGGDLQKLVML